jgi:hypothetical protein
MTHRNACIDREIIGATDFDTALEAYKDGRDLRPRICCAPPETCWAPITMGAERAEALGELTGCTDVFGDYDDAGCAVCRWFALAADPGARH